LGGFDLLTRGWLSLAGGLLLFQMKRLSVSGKIIRKETMDDAKFFLADADCLGDSAVF
jgi:hypothetical protein